MNCVNLGTGTSFAIPAFCPTWRNLTEDNFIVSIKTMYTNCSWADCYYDGPRSGDFSASANTVINYDANTGLLTVTPPTVPYAQKITHDIVIYRSGSIDYDVWLVF